MEAQKIGSVIESPGFWRASPEWTDWVEVPRRREGFPVGLSELMREDDEDEVVLIILVGKRIDHPNEI